MIMTEEQAASGMMMVLNLSEGKEKRRGLKVRAGQIFVGGNYEAVCQMSHR
jgi:hypothetical protein